MHAPIILPNRGQGKRQTGIVLKNALDGADGKTEVRFVGKSFVLKGQRGEAAGFLQQSGRTLRCKASGGAEHGRLVLCFADGSRQSLELALDGSEQEWPDDGKRAIDCAYVFAAGSLLFCTDERGRRAYEQDALREQRPARREQREAAPAADDAQSAATAHVQGVAQDARADGGDEAPEPYARAEARDDEGRETRELPEGRWPPPPCMPSARYRQGRWEDVGVTSPRR